MNTLQEVSASASEPYGDKSIGCAYYLHKAGLHDKSFEQNVKLANLAYSFGDLDLAERCYQRAIDDAEKLGKTDQKMNCLLELSRNVYMRWDGRHVEARNNYNAIREYSVSVNDNGLEVLVLSELANYYDVTENNYDESLRILNECSKLLTENQSNNFYAIGAIEYQIAGIFKKQEKYSEALEKYISSLELFKRSVLISNQSD